MSDTETATSYEGKLIVGLTGNVATGKSAILHMADEMGAFTIDADKIVHELMDADANMQAAIAVAFGSEIRREDGRINRKELGKIVFDDAQALKDLEAMVHPAVRRIVDQRILNAKQNIIFIEAIKLLEGDLASICHSVWVTRCTPTRQLERLRICRGMETEPAKNRIKAQNPQEEKVAQADVVIDTNGLMKDTELQFTMAWNRLPAPFEVQAKDRLPSTDTVEPPIPGTGILSRETDGQMEPGGDTKSKQPKAQKDTASAPDAVVVAPAEPGELVEVDGNEVQVRRARPSDIPSILLLIQKATDGRVKMKRAELLMALSERGYFIGQIGTEINAVMGYHMDSQVARVDEIFIHPPEMMGVAAVILKEIQQSAFAHMGQIIVIFLPKDAPEALRQVFAEAGYVYEEKSKLAKNWQLAIDESQPEDTDYVLKIMVDIRKKS